MEINEETLKTIIEKVLLEIENSSKIITENKKDMYLVFQEQWDERYDKFISQIRSQQKYNIYSIIPGSLQDKAERLGEFSKVILRKDIDLSTQTPDLTVFPVASQSFVAKLALAIDDTFETRWVRNCFSKGKKVLLISSGLDAFTGKEPEKYVGTIKSYYRTILEYGVEIVEDVFLYQEPRNQSKCEKPENICTNINNGKRIITANDIATYSSGKVLSINAGDVITELAKDKAESLGIAIVRNY